MPVPGAALTPLPATSTMRVALYAFETSCSSLGVSGVSPDLVLIGRDCRHVRRNSSRALRDVALATHVKNSTSRASLDGKELLTNAAVYTSRFCGVAQAGRLQGSKRTGPALSLRRSAGGKRAL